MPVQSKYLCQHRDEAVFQFTLTNNNKIKACLINLGATLQEMWLPDQSGQLVDVVLGFDSVEDYASEANPYFGATVGPFANRIAKGKFSLNGKDYQLAINNGENHLHGGPENGLSGKVWKSEIVSDQSVRFFVDAPDGEENYPGNRQFSVTYTLNDQDELIIDYSATTDQDTIVNMTNHSYWNLAGHDSGSVEQHLLQVNADQYAPLSTVQIPTGELECLDNHLLDFRHPKSLGEVFPKVENFKVFRGIDHPFALQNDGQLKSCATYSDPASGRALEVLTTKPCVQVYTANWVDNLGKNGAHYQAYHGICLETQNFPDAINQANFPSPVLKAGETYTSQTVHRFSY